MIRLITQPTGNKTAREHYVDTLQNYVRIEQIEEFLSDTDKSVLNDLYPTGDIQIWM